MEQSIYHDLEVNGTIEKTFKAITQPEHLINWWPQNCKGIPKENEVYNFFFTPEYDWYGRVIKLEENKSFHIKMTKSDPDWNPTSFGFDLEENSTGTVLLKFWHTGWPKCNHHFRRSSYCWAILLKGLKDYVEHGKIIPFEERQ
ncbi:SRPBCC domain-containing protein [Muricauda sp. 334s03]|uniref:SRPBCC domain-containing protein n=1 Tax=Flagellimonas yonaguniensis TaxID=3031325 RepID=A0ABT5XZ19_9FLAO|nr:SRPBCC domain-containing protein [[Muricauda] yonaguniensis]MDF0716438.1 SRPBCC domain-containing protein [[Muricauda] yonaguniensis]